MFSHDGVFHRTTGASLFVLLAHSQTASRCHKNDIPLKDGYIQNNVGFSLFISISLVEKIKIGYYLQDHIKLKFLVLYALGTIKGTIFFLFLYQCLR